MFDSLEIVTVALGYVTALFALAWIGDRTIRSRKGDGGRPLIYALSIAVYCTSWTFFGSVGLAAQTGYDFIPVYLGPILMFAIGWPIVLRIVRLAKSQNITSVADFMAARYGKSQAVSAVVTLVAVVGTLPYIALQLKAIAVSVEALIGGGPLVHIEVPQFGFLETAFVITLALAGFAVLFGTRHIDATEHQDGLMLAIAAESLIKLAAFIAVGLYVVVAIHGGPVELLEKVRAHAGADSVFGGGLKGGFWLTVTFLSFVCVILLPRQFHVIVVENNSAREVRRAAWLFPLYLVLINLFVVPIAMAGLLLPKGSVEPDFFVLGLPMAEGSKAMATIAFVGGLSAATAMVIVESIALSIMVCNGVVIPMLLTHRSSGTGEREDMAGLLLAIRRISIFIILMLGFLVYRLLGRAEALSTIGLISFAAIAQLAPAFFLGMVWRNGTARGAIAGMLAGFAVWAYTLLLPWVAKAGYMPADLVEHGPLGLAFLKPQALFYLEFDWLPHGVLWSLAANVTAYAVVSLLRAPEPIERLQAHVFVQDEAPRAAPGQGFRLWRSSITVGELQSTASRYLGAERAERSFSEYAASRSSPLAAHSEADIQCIRFTEHLLASAIGAASSRLVLSLLLRRNNVGSQSALRLLDDASEALQYNRDLLQSAIDQVRHGLSVFDKDMRLICWNRQFRELLDLPAELGRVGVPLDRILRVIAERGDLGPGAVDALVADRLMKLAVTRETFQERLTAGRRILEIRTAQMPQGGIVTTYAEITDRVEAASALARANETLERRVRERTAELLEVNAALAVAKAKADEANLDKTRFLAAASHDILQPLNAARLYTTSLVERALPPADGQLARNIDASLSAVEEILGTLIDISRMDAGRLEPEIGAVRLGDMLQQLAVEFAPQAAEKGLRLTVVATSACVRSDRRLLRRMLQNLLSNAIKYTAAGRVLVGVRRRGATITVAVYDTGPGIPASKHAVIFKEFQRLEGAHQVARGLGLGLSIVERAGRVLEHTVRLDSVVGRGSMFAVDMPAAVGLPAVCAAADHTTVAAPGSLGGIAVLCIDNEPAVLEGMRTLLSGWGCVALTASGLGEAYTTVVDAGIVPDVILADYHLDAGTGLEAIAALRTWLGSAVPAAIITADHSPELQRDVRVRELGLLRKPVKAAALRALLTQYTLRRTGVAAE